MNEKAFKNTLIKALEMHYDDIGIMDESMITVRRALPRCELYIEETYVYSQRDWNAYQSVLHIRGPLETHSDFESQKEVIFEQADRIYGRQGDHYLDVLEIDILLETPEVIDLQHLEIYVSNQRKTVL